MPDRETQSAGDGDNASQDAGASSRGRNEATDQAGLSTGDQSGLSNEDQSTLSTEDQPRLSTEDQPRLYPEDQAKVNEFVTRGVNSVERKPFRPLRLMLMLIGVVLALSLFSQWLARWAGVY